MSPGRLLPVVCAVLVNDAGEVLLAQRPASKHLGGKWEFAGGKVEAGESPALALQRELLEELQCQVQIRRALPEFDHDYGDVIVHMIPFVCRLAPDSAEPSAHEHVAIRWVDEPTLRSMDLAPADWPVVENYFGRSR
jgi:8-oxo-dGTP diphosphatase